MFLLAIHWNQTVPHHFAAAPHYNLAINIATHLFHYTDSIKQVDIINPNYEIIASIP